MTKPAASGTASPADALWTFATAVYGCSGVASACLALQDRDGIDVCLLLASVWAGRCGHRPEEPACSSLQAVARRWNIAAIVPVRTARRLLRRVQCRPEDALRVATDLAAGRLAEVELSLERSQLAELAEAITLTPVGPPARARARRLARRIAGCRDRVLLSVIVRAAFSASDACNQDVITAT